MSSTLGARPALPGAVEEVLRYQTAAGDVARIATEDVQLGDTTVPARNKVLVSLNSADRDERRFTEPERFDITPWDPDCRWPGVG